MENMNHQRGRKPEFFDGEIIKCSAVGDLILGDVLYSSSYTRSKHTHERACFHFLFEGGYTEFSKNRSQQRQALTLFFQPQGHEHAYACHSVVSRAFTIEIGGTWMERLREYSVVLNDANGFHDGVLSWLVTRLYHEFQAMDASSPLVIESIALEMAVEASRRVSKRCEGKPPKWLRRVEDMLRGHFAEPLSLKDIAQSANIHPVHLARVFRQHRGCTVGEYIRKLRIDFACQELYRSDSSLLEIALSAGFFDQSQFSRTFKKAMGLTPLQYRIALRSR